jgi:hypothetical protein
MEKATKEEIEKAFREYITKSLDDFIKYTPLNGNNLDTELFIWFISPATIP